jgi:hypothetical protein
VELEVAFAATSVFSAYFGYIRLLVALTTVKNRFTRHLHTLKTGRSGRCHLAVCIGRAFCRYWPLRFWV